MGGGLLSIFLAIIGSFIILYFGAESKIIERKENELKQNQIHISGDDVKNNILSYYKKNYDILNLPIDAFPHNRANSSPYASSSLVYTGISKYCNNIDISKCSFRDRSILHNLNYAMRTALGAKTEDKVLVSNRRICKYTPSTKKTKCVGHVDDLGNRYAFLNGLPGYFPKDKTSGESIDSDERIYNTLINFIDLIPYQDFMAEINVNGLIYQTFSVPTLEINLYHVKNYKEPDFSKTPIKINTADIVQGMVFDAKLVNEKIHGLIGEEAKRRAKGFVKRDNIRAVNTYSVLGDSIDVSKSNQITNASFPSSGKVYSCSNLANCADVGKDYVVFSTNTDDYSTDDSKIPPTAYFSSSKPYKFVSGIASGDAIVIPMLYVDGKTITQIGTLGSYSILDNNLSTGSSGSLGSVSNYYFSPNHYLLFNNAREVYYNKLRNQSRIGGASSLAKDVAQTYWGGNTYKNHAMQNFCFSTEPCFVTYFFGNASDKGITAIIKSSYINDMYVRSISNMLESWYGFSAKSYKNPFYPNSQFTLFPFEENGVIFSSTNAGKLPTPGVNVLYIGLKTIPLENYFVNSQSDYFRNYILSRYTISYGK